MKNFEEYLANHIRLTKESQSLGPIIGRIIKQMLERLKKGGTIYFCGNGGSAAEAQHLAAEFVGRFKIDRQALKAHALTVDTSVLTSISNDYGFNCVFSRQIEGLGSEKDILISLSTSGNSENIFNALKTAKSKKLLTINLLGHSGGRLKGLADIEVLVPSRDTFFIQEIHLMIGHYICYEIERQLFEK